MGTRRTAATRCGGHRSATTAWSSPGDGDPLCVDGVVAEHRHRLDIDEVTVAPELTTHDTLTHKPRLLVAAPGPVVATEHAQRDLLHGEVAEGVLDGELARLGAVSPAQPLPWSDQ